jgi:glycosyltransferase involved in cell wall biosynthesis
MVDARLGNFGTQTTRGTVACAPNLAEESVREKKLVILMIDDKVPEYDQHAGGLTTYHYTQLFADMGFKVVFLPDDLQRREPYASEMEQNGVNLIYGSGFNFNSWIRTNGKYVPVAWLTRPHVAAKYIDKLKEHSGAEILYYTGDLHYLRLERQYEIDRNMSVLREANHLKNLEFSIFRKADVILTPSDAERDIISKAFPTKRVVNIPGWIFRDLPAGEMASPYADRRDIVFLGGFRHTPNIDAVLWFVSEVLPHISDRLPSVRFFIVGSYPPANIRALASEQVIVTGYVKDLAPYLGRARVFVAPLRYGAGAKGKIVVAMSYGVPVVTTTIGAEGLPLVNGKNCLIEDDPEQFAKAVVRLYTDRSLWERLSQNGIELVRTNFSEATAEAKMVEIMALKECPVCENSINFPRTT